MAGIRSGGFGLNFDYGFKPGKSFMIGSNQGQNSGFAQQQAAQKQADDLQRQLFNLREAGDTSRANISAGVQRYGIDSRNNQFDRVFGMLSRGMGGIGGGGLVGGASGPSPEITVGPIYSPGMIQQEINAGRASNDQRTAQQLRGIERQMGARGYASGSPLQMALNQQARQQNMIANTDVGRQTRWDTAQANADQVLKSQVAREQQFASRQGEDIERRKSNNQLRSAYVSALASLL